MITITPTKWFRNMCIHSQNETDSNLPSGLEIAFPLDSGAFFLILNKATFVMI